MLVSPAVFKPAVFEPAVFEPAVFEPAVFEPAVFEPAVFEPAVFEPAVFKPAVFVLRSIWHVYLYDHRHVRFILCHSLVVTSLYFNRYNPSSIMNFWKARLWASVT